MASRFRTGWQVYVAAVALAHVALAQGGAVVPSAQAGVEGGSGTSIPFGFSQPARFMCIYDAEELPFSGPRAINVVSFRADNDNPGTTTFPAKGFVVVTLKLSTSTVKAESASSVFDDNHGADLTTVLYQVPVMLPAQPVQASGSRAANIDFVLPTPWFYGLTQVRPNEPPPDSLVVELQIHSQPAGSYRLDALGNCSSNITQFGNIGPSCFHVDTSANPSAQPLTVVPGPSLQAGVGYSWDVNHGEPNSAVLLMFDVMGQTTFLGQPLPLALFDPADPTLPNPNLTGVVLNYPAADCYINVPAVTTLLGVGDANGNTRFTVNMPAGRRFVGMSFRAQAIGYSQTANPMQLIASAGQEATVCGPLGVARIYQFGSATIASGQLSRGQGAVIELR
jgi:hypothetical protein